MDLISNILCKSVHLVYQNLNEIKSFLYFAMQTSRFYVKHPVYSGDFGL